MVMQLDNMTHSAEGFVRPNGTKHFPARSCCDLKEEYLDTPSGENFSVLDNIYSTMEFSSVD